MQKALKPLGAAVLAARPPQLPATTDAVRTIAQAAKLDEALLIDPWNTPYKARSSIEYDNEAVMLLIDEGTIRRYELQPDRIVFYIWSWSAAGTHFSFRFTPHFAIRAKAAPATLSDYYNPDQTVMLAPQTFTVIGRPTN